MFAEVGRGESFDRQAFAIDKRGKGVDVAVSEAIVSDWLPETSGLVLWIVFEQVDDVLHLARGNTHGLQGVDDFVGCAIGGPGRQRSIDIDSVIASFCFGRPRRISDRLADNGRECWPLRIGGYRDGDKTITCRVDLVGHMVVQAIAITSRLGLVVVGEVVEQRWTDRIGADLKLGHVDLLADTGAVPGFDRCQRGGRGTEAGEMVIEREARTNVAPVGEVGEMGDAADRVDRGRIGNHVFPRPVVATSRHGHIDQLRIPFVHGLVVEAPRFEDTSAVILDQHI